MPAFNFTIDSALLEELGASLVGKPYIALAELAKNGYDADAKIVTIELEAREDRIVVEDNGHGMTLEEFKNFWMRIGSTHQRGNLSRNFNRVLTGSKGIGRLAVQYLAGGLILYTVSEYDLNTQIKAWISWDEAVRAGDLVDAIVNYEIITSDTEFSQGTKIVLSGLKQTWDIGQIQDLARQIWQLEPPFRSKFMAGDEEKEFKINFISSEGEVVTAFEEQLKAILRIWYAKIVGINKKGEVNFSLQFAGEDQINHTYIIPDCELENGEFEIRIYHLFRRQPHGIKVGDARDYLNDFGGVYVYDGGFQVPYYGNRENDWLRLERDHSHRLSKSPLLPKALQDGIRDAMNFLPTTSRTLGVVSVNTSIESILAISITRDRLEINEAYKNLQDIIRYAIDFYALHEKIRRTKLGDIQKPKYKKIEDVLENYRSEIKKETYKTLQKELRNVAKAVETESEEIAKRVSLVGALSTAGITSLAYQHETKHQHTALKKLILDLDKIIEGIENYDLRNSLIKINKELKTWLERMTNTNELFTYLSDNENLVERDRYSARAVIENVIDQIKILRGNIKIDTSIIEYILLPEASLAEWSSIFQNVFINAFNALLESDKKQIQVSVRKQGKERELLVQDTGHGVELRNSQKLFEPFIRGPKISKEMQALGYGGTGLGLTIVKLIAYNIGCEVSFTQPEQGFNTAFSLKWSERI